MPNMNNGRLRGGTDEEAKMICMKTRTVLIVLAGIFLVLGILHILNIVFKFSDQAAFDYSLTSTFGTGWCMLIALLLCQQTFVYCLCSFCGCMTVIWSAVALTTQILASNWLEKTLQTKFPEKFPSSTTIFPKTDGKIIITLVVLYSMNIITYGICSIGFFQLADVFGRSERGPGGINREDNYDVERSVEEEEEGKKSDSEH